MDEVDESLVKNVKMSLGEFTSVYPEGPEDTSETTHNQVQTTGTNIKMKNMPEMDFVDIWQTLYERHKLEFKRKEDILILFMHCCLLKFQWLCLGDGNLEGLPVDRTDADDTLFKDWNKFSSLIRYTKDTDIYILHGNKNHPDDEDFTVYFVNYCTSCWVKLTFKTEEHVRLFNGLLHEIFIKPVALYDEIQLKLLHFHI